MFEEDGWGRDYTVCGLKRNQVVDVLVLTMFPHSFQRLGFSTDRTRRRRAISVGGLHSDDAFAGNMQEGGNFAIATFANRAFEFEVAVEVRGVCEVVCDRAFEFVSRSMSVDAHSAR